MGKYILGILLSMGLVWGAYSDEALKPASAARVNCKRQTKKDRPEPLKIVTLIAGEKTTITCGEVTPPPPPPTPPPEPPPTPPPGPVTADYYYPPIGGPRSTNTATSGDVTVSIDGATTARISPYVFGMNTNGSTTKNPLYRWGGNRFTGYNWKNGMSHAGTDWNNQNDLFLCMNRSCTREGDVVKNLIDESFKNGAAALITVPILDYVAFRESNGDVCPAANRTSTNECTTRDYWSTLFTRNSVEYQRDFIAFIRGTYPNDQSRIMWSLDNEPALWGATHNRLRPMGEYCVHNPTYEEVLKRNIDFGLEIKRQLPDAWVLGPVSYGWLEIYRLQWLSSCTGHQNEFWYPWYLAGLRDASEKQNGGRPIVNIIDSHWYSEAQGSGGQRIVFNNPDNPENDAARMQAPRSLWDASYIERSWITTDLGNKPIELLPRLHRWINESGYKVGTAFTEYSHGGENRMSGAVAQADTLGIFATEGVTVATFWGLEGSRSAIDGAFRMYLDFGFGGNALSTVTNSVERLTAYASQMGNRIVLVVINKSSGPIGMNIRPSNLSFTPKTMQINGLDTGFKPVQIINGVYAEKIILPSTGVFTIIIN